MTANKPGDSRKKEILEAAMRCYTKKGYHATTIDDIAKEAKLTKGGVYWHFKSKWSIFLAILEQHKIDNRKLWDKMKNFPNKEAALTEGGLLFAKEHTSEKLKICNEIEIEALRNDKIKDDFLSVFKEDKENIIIQLKEAYESGIIRELDFESVTMIIIFMISGIQKHYWLEKGKLDIEKIWRVFSDAILNGILKK
jgi:AcrR family transcriptional regulator